ncbi:hypothetical protein EOD39_4926 [Acipenser ruthenus]|uniref:Uncharacterized protein n=1 Tax=Acipenser ruthenus TaxID=7906 RepID=A0A444UG92_ACIRT|nr:hypothetical protein EOD39_4926 [Acipenser ruthenus]
MPLEEVQEELARDRFLEALGVGHLHAPVHPGTLQEAMELAAQRESVWANERPGSAQKLAKSQPAVRQAQPCESSTESDTHALLWLLVTAMLTSSRQWSSPRVHICWNRNQVRRQEITQGPHRWGTVGPIAEPQEKLHPAAAARRGPKAQPRDWGPAAPRSS